MPPPLPSGFFVASPIEIVGSSSFWMVPVPLASVIWLPAEAFDRPIVNVSSSSSTASVTRATLTVLLVWPAVKVSVPLVVA